MPLRHIDTARRFDRLLVGLKAMSPSDTDGLLASMITLAQLSQAIIADVNDLHDNIGELRDDLANGVTPNPNRD